MKPVPISQRIGGARWWIAPDQDPRDAVSRIEAALARVEAGAVDHKDGRRKSLYRLALAGDSPDHQLKVTRYRNGSPWTRRTRRGKAHRELSVVLEQQPVAWLARRMHEGGSEQHEFPLEPLFSEGYQASTARGALRRDDRNAGAA